MSVTCSGYLGQPYDPQLNHQHGEVSVNQHRTFILSSQARVSQNTERQMDGDRWMETDGWRQMDGDRWMETDGSLRFTLWVS